MRRPSSRDLISQIITDEGWSRISDSAWLRLRTALSSISESTLRKQLAALDIPVDQPWRGVNTSSFDLLEETLRGLTDVYTEQPEPARSIVIRAKDQARFISRNPKVSIKKRAIKAEMVEWMLVWLGDPRMFPVWVGLRRAAMREK